MLKGASLVRLLFAPTERDHIPADSLKRVCPDEGKQTARGSGNPNPKPLGGMKIIGTRVSKQFPEPPWPLQLNIRR